MDLFVRLTLLLAAALVALAVVAFLFKIIVLAAVVAGVAIAILFLVNFVKSFARRSGIVAR